MNISKYLSSLFSLKKFISRNIALTAIWDSKSEFSNKAYIRYNVRLINSKIGKYTRIKQNCILSNVTIGNFCGIGQNTQIGTGRHPTNLLSTNLIFYKRNTIRNDWQKPINFNEYLPIEIGNDVWIGIQCLIMDGVKIGDGAIIGSRSVVTKNIPPYAIAVGAPAKIVKYRFSEEIVKRLLEIQWWNLSDEDMTEMINLFTMPEITLEILNQYFPPEV